VAPRCLEFKCSKVCSLNMDLSVLCAALNAEREARERIRIARDAFDSAVQDYVLQIQSVFAGQDCRFVTLRMTPQCRAWQPHSKRASAASQRLWLPSLLQFHPTNTSSAAVARQLDAAGSTTCGNLPARPSPKPWPSKTFSPPSSSFHSTLSTRSWVFRVFCIRSSSLPPSAIGLQN
jgi:hypothetical protein